MISYRWVSVYHIANLHVDFIQSPKFTAIYLNFNEHFIEMKCLYNRVKWNNLELNRSSFYLSTSLLKIVLKFNDN